MSWLSRYCRTSWSFDAHVLSPPIHLETMVFRGEIYVDARPQYWGGCQYIAHRYTGGQRVPGLGDIVTDASSIPQV